MPYPSVARFATLFPKTGYRYHNKDLSASAVERMAELALSSSHPLTVIMSAAVQRGANGVPQLCGS